MQNAIDELWGYTGEFFIASDAEKIMAEKRIGVDVSSLKNPYYSHVSSVLEESQLSVPDNTYFQKGGKNGVHTEYMGYILSELQYMQRTYPNMTW
jgi:ring-1,2-phenylacetyl-CoA epoxidase subunit PaaC